MRIGEYEITVDTYNYILNKHETAKRKSKEDENKFEEYDRVSLLGYFSKAEHLVHCIFDDIVKYKISEKGDDSVGYDDFLKIIKDSLFKINEIGKEIESVKQKL